MFQKSFTVFALVLTAAFLVGCNIPESATINEKSEAEIVVTAEPQKFSGKLESIKTNCFADGICSAMIDGKEVIAISGWSQETVGKVIGVDGFGDLESKIGQDVEVYAQPTETGFTLYGDENFYIEVK